MPKSRARKRKRFSPQTRPTGFPIIELAGKKTGAGFAPDALAVDVGEINSPIRDWSDLVAIVPTPILTTIRRRLDSGRAQLVAIRYSRGQETGVLAPVSTAAMVANCLSFAQLSQRRQVRGFGFCALATIGPLYKGNVPL
jgi:hypothetical protein